LQRTHLSERMNARKRERAREEEKEREHARPPQTISFAVSPFCGRKKKVDREKQGGNLKEIDTDRKTGDNGH